MRLTSITATEMTFGAAAATTVAVVVNTATAAATGASLLAAAAGGAMATLPFAAGAATTVGALIGGRAALRTGLKHLDRKGWTRHKDLIASQTAVVDSPTWLGAIDTRPLQPIALPKGILAARHHGRELDLAGDGEIRNGSPLPLAERRNELQQAAAYLEKGEGPESPRGSILRLMAVCPDDELHGKLRTFYHVVEAWLSYEPQFGASTLVSGRHIIEVISDQCRKMAEDPALHQSNTACSALSSALEPRLPQLWEDVEAIRSASKSNFIANMDALATHLENACSAPEGSR